MSVEADALESLSDVYTHRVRDDLERVEAEIARTEARLRALRADHVLLSRIWENLGDPSEATPAAAAASRGRSSESEAGTSGTTGRPPARSSSAGTGRRAPAAERGSVRDAVLTHLRASKHPVSVNDIFAALPAKVQTSGKVVVRNTVEALVAKGTVVRAREGKSVRYTLVPTSTEADV
ncbi:BlaI/MecI/CopY family transcriptional regulator [Streptomyces sp. ME109]|uniref:BlaI/MecI/CopY family transcriptional regulator n=1 Tax=Streptomyces sp. me109 TaxID=1827853 RepID=UPI0011CDC50B|nr:BlaI/MecI/CopY family transcriptional regulator [Streptomyces sp. me109]